MINKIIPYLGFFPYKEVAEKYWPAVLRPLLNFDGLHYLLIARDGYKQFQQAFFPLYPILIRLMAKLVGNNYLIAELLVSWICLMFALIVWKKVFVNFKVKEGLKNWLFFPTAFFLICGYTESLFLLMMGLVVLGIMEKKDWMVIVGGLGASLTKVIGIFLVIIISWKNLKKWWLNIGVLGGFLGYCFYLFKTTGDPLFFFHAQSAFGANRSTNLILLPQVYWRYFKIIFTAQHDFKYFVAVFEVLIFSIVFYLLIKQLINLIKKKDWGIKMAINWFSLAVIILPTLTGTFSSLPRYTLMAFGIFLDDFKYQTPYRIIGAILMIIGFLFFTQGYFVS